MPSSTYGRDSLHLLAFCAFSVLTQLSGHMPMAAAKALPLLGPKEDTWHVIVHKLRVWAPVMNGEKPKSAAEEENLKFVRPFLILIVSVRTHCRRQLGPGTCACPAALFMPAPNKS